MLLSSLHRKAGLAALVLALSVAVTACSDDEGQSGADGSSGETSSEAATSDEESMTGDDEMAASEGATEEAMGAEAQTFGPGCASVPKTGGGSFDGMATAPVASAASENPLLTTLVAAVGQAGLVDTLNSAEGLTVFAPTDDAFAEIPKKDLDAVLADKELLTQILTHHVVEGQMGPEELSGELQTLNGDTLKVEGSGENLTVGDEDAAVLCGNIPTANATVYVVDTVLMP